MVYHTIARHFQSTTSLPTCRLYHPPDSTADGIEPASDDVTVGPDWPDAVRFPSPELPAVVSVVPVGVVHPSGHLLGGRKHIGVGETNADRGLFARIHHGHLEVVGAIC